jgi:TatD DNase family protein
MRSGRRRPGRRRRVIDTHAHLDGGMDEAAAVVRRAQDAGVTRIVAVGSGIESSRATLRLAHEHDGVYAALGIHPHQAGSDDATRLAELRELLGAGRVVAVGETGLDFYRDYAPHDAQLELFERQLALAEELAKPVVIHTRAADDPTARALGRFGGTVVLHCFSSPGLLPVALERGYYVSFAGNVTFPKAADLRGAAAAVPGDRLLAETDSPYLAPQPVRGRENEPAHVVHTLTTLAEVRGEDPGALEAQIDANATAAFGLS